MKTIRVIKIEGLEDVDKNSTVEMYTYREMRSNKNYCMEDADKDEFVNNMSSPIGWVVQDRLEKGWIFIPILPSDEYEEAHDDPLYTTLLLHDLPHSGVLN